MKNIQAHTDSFIYNGQVVGDVAERLIAANGDPNSLRPWSENGKTYITTRNAEGKPVAHLISNTATSIRRYDWMQLDTAIVKAARQRLKAVGIVRGAGLNYVIPGGMSRTVLQTEIMDDPGSAVVSMDGLRSGPNDRPNFDQTLLPLPITHADFSFSARQILASRNGGSPLDTTMAEVAGRRVAESVEQHLLGTVTGISYGGGQIFGLTNYTYRTTGTVTAPTASGWTGTTLLNEVLAMIQDAYSDLHFGPYRLFISTAWDQYLGRDFKTTSDKSVRTRLNEIEAITSIDTCDYLSGYDMVLVQMTSDVVRMVVGMEITTVQWDTDGGLKKNFKVMCILVPQVRSDYNQRCGIVHYTTS